MGRKNFFEEEHERDLAAQLESFERHEEEKRQQQNERAKERQQQRQQEAQATLESTPTSRDGKRKKAAYDKAVQTATALKAAKLQEVLSSNNLQTSGSKAVLANR